MKKIKYLSVVLLAFSLPLMLFFSACKKYPEDGKRSWHKPEKRIIGAWYLKEFLVDGSDSTYLWYDKKTSDLTDTIKWQLINTRFTFDDGKDKKSSSGQTVDIYDANIYIKYSPTQLIGNIHIISNWEIQNKKSQLYFNSNYDFKKSSVLVTSFSIFGNITDTWDIKKLTDKEMILETNSNNSKHIRIKFQK